MRRRSRRSLVSLLRFFSLDQLLQELLESPVQQKRFLSNNRVSELLRPRGLVFRAELLQIRSKGFYVPEVEKHLSKDQENLEEPEPLVRPTETLRHKHQRRINDST